MRILQLTLLSLLLTLVACDNSPMPQENIDDFDRQAMLTNWADNIIVPAYTDFNTQAQALKLAGENFAQSPDLNQLEQLRSAWTDAYKSWQQVAMFATGKAEEVRLRDFLNIYPVDTSALLENIRTANYDLSLPSEYDEQGFAALDYLLYGLGSSDDQTLAFFTTDPDAPAFAAYVAELTARIEDLSTQVLQDWEGAYRDAFVDNSGNSATASVDRMVNDYIFYYEKHLRAGKVGIPAGVFSGTPLPTHTEALYQGGISKELLLISLDAVQNFFNGKHFASEEEGQSLKDYLNYLSTEKDGSQLSQLIDKQFEEARTAIQGLDEDLSTQVQNDNLKMLGAYDQLQLNVVLLKVDMLQALNINVDYVDADGD